MEIILRIFLFVTLVLSAIPLFSPVEFEDEVPFTLDGMEEEQGLLE
jgi:hypothetical protein